MSESLAQSLADSYWPEVLVWIKKNPEGDFKKSGDVFMWVERDAERAGAPAQGLWNARDVTLRTLEILKERVEKYREQKARMCGCGFVHKSNERCGPW